MANDLLDLPAHGLLADAERLQGLGGHALALLDEAEQDVLGTDVVVVEHPGLFLSQDRNPPRPVGEPLEHHRFLTERLGRQLKSCSSLPHASPRAGRRCACGCRTTRTYPVARALTP